jgi:hypothetical protein
MKNLLKRKWLIASLCVLALWIIYPVLRVGFFFITDPIPDDRKIVLNESIINDASGLNKTRHGGVISLVKDLNKSITILKDLVTQARTEKKKIIPIGARHSMGKQSLGEGVIHVDLSALNGMKMEDGLLRVETGARWKEVLQFLAPLGLSVEVMQSNADFSIGGTMSVNAHGWQPNRPPVSSTVQKISLLNANGEVLICSRSQNIELFKHSLGGYGLMGIILEAWIKPVPNEILRSSHQIVEYQNFTQEWNKMKQRPVRLAFGRLSVAPDTFFEQVLLTSYENTNEISRQPAEYKTSLKTSLARAIFRASLNSDRGKSFRQWTENLIGGEAGGVHSRANLLIEPVRIFTNNQKGKTDILVEIFLPQDKFSDFIPHAKNLMINQSENLLNVTIREIMKDTDSALPYAKKNVFGLVMLFTIDQNQEAEKKLQKQMVELIEITLNLDGTFYLPYRNFSNGAQLKKGYPGLGNFISIKKKWDSDEIFSSGFYDYLLQSVSKTSILP